MSAGMDKFWKAVICWLFNNWGNLASFLGLLVSISAVLAATKAASSAEAARVAAEEAKHSMISQSVTHTLGETKRLVGELTTLISSSSIPAAQIRSQDLSQNLRYVIKRWGAESMTVDTMMNLVEAQTQTDSITEKLHLPPPGGLPKTEVRRILSLLHRISNTITAEHATAEKRGEEYGFK